MTFHFLTKAAAAVALSAALSVAAFGSGIIDFEPDTNGKLPNGDVAVDDMAISTQYQASDGVVFGIDNNLDGQADPNVSPKLEKIGPSAVDGFTNDTEGGLRDKARTGFEPQLGNYFLRTDGGTSNLLITYTTTPTAAAAGEIWDIDGSLIQHEQWRVEALDASSNVIDWILSPLGNYTLTWDAKPWTFAFNHGANADIHAIRLAYVGNTSGGRGVAFNNFSPVSVPEPSTLVLLVFGMLGFLVVKRR